MGNAESTHRHDVGNNDSSLLLDDSSLTYGKNSTCDETDPNSTSGSAASIADQSVAMMSKLMSGGASALCGSLKQVDVSYDESRQDHASKTNDEGIFTKAERLVNCNKFAQSEPLDIDFAARSERGRRGGNFLGPEEDSDDEVDVSSAFRNGISKNFQDDSGVNNTSGSNLNDTSATSAMSRLFARAMVSEVTDNPNTMKPEEMAEREKRLLKAQERARQAQPDGPRVVGTPGGIAPSGVLGAIKNFSLKGEQDNDVMSRDPNHVDEPKARVVPPSVLSPKGDVKPSATTAANAAKGGKHTITVGLCLSRKHSAVGHPDTVTRQTAFDFNELQDRNYKYVSSTDSSGWLAGGGESADGPMPDVSTSLSGDAGDDLSAEDGHVMFGQTVPLNGSGAGKNAAAQATKIAAADTVHIPILHIDCESEEAVDQVISSLASGEVFIPHMQIIPESLSANGDSPPDLVVRFGCERNDDLSPDEWPNWCLEFMHNQLYEYFRPLGARWEPRPFEITLARKVRWRTVKHMNKYFAHCERVIDAWREEGPQYLNPQLSFLEDGASPEEVSTPHGIYLMRNGRPTNYFAPNFEPPYTTKMTRSLLSNVINKSWDKKKRDWTSVPTPKLVTPAMLLGTMCGCTDGNQGGFVATEVTRQTLSPVTQPYVHPEDVMANNLTTDSNNITAFDQSGEYSEFERLRKSSTSQNDTSGAVFGNESSNNVSDLPTEDKNAIIENSSEFGGEVSIISKDNSAGSSGILGSRTPQMIKTVDANTNFFPTSADVVEQEEQESPSSTLAAEGQLIQEQEQAKTQQGHVRAIAETIQKQESSRRKKKEKPSSRSRSRRSKSGEDRHLSKVASIGESHTTVPINNKSAPKIIEDERNRRREREIEKEENTKKMAALEKKLQEKKDKAVREEKNRLQQEKKTRVKADRERKLKKRAKKKKESIDDDREDLVASEEDLLRNQLIAEAQEETRKARALISKSVTRHEHHTTGIRTSPSGETLEYSVDSSSILREKANAQMARAATSTPKTLDYGDGGRDDFSSSTVESSIPPPPPDGVPSDEELFAFGWAKALDPNTGAYYYFTLDRKETVWTNPLTNRDFVANSASNLASPVPGYANSAY